METSTNLENDLSYQIIAKSADELTREEIFEFELLADREAETAVRAMEAKNAHWEDLWEEATIPGGALSAIKDAERRKLDSVILLAKDMNGQMLGFSVVIIDPAEAKPRDKVKESFIGVIPGSRKRGVGINLLRLRSKILLEKGITSYSTNVRPEAKRLYDRLGLKYTESPHPNNPKASSLVVYLK